jgi:hypothetical protein
VTFYLVAWIATTYPCPWWVPAGVRGPAREALCGRKDEARHELLAGRGVAERLVRELGAEAHPTLDEVRGARLRRIPISWAQRVDFGP